MKVAGANEYCQLCADSNNKSASYYPVISPPVESRLDISQALSYSVYRDHAVWIAREMKAHAVGDNSNGRISGDLPLDKLSSESNFEVCDPEGKSYDLISAVCGSWYTLYLVQPSNSPEARLAYVVYNKNNGKPLFLQLNGRRPIGLFGGENKSAAIDSTGSIIIVSEAIFEMPDPVPQVISLPGDEKAVSLACCNNFIGALSSSGRVYLSVAKDGGSNFSDFAEVPTLSGIKFTEISGTFEHCLAVSEEGKVFGLGSNYNGALGLGRRLKKVDKFREITSIENVKVKNAFAGFNNSLFLTEEGKLFACGNNSCGQLLSSAPPSTKFVSMPKETLITEGATFCIAGYALSAVFVGSEPPPYSPNKKINDELLEKQKKLVQQILEKGMQIDIPPVLQDESQTQTKAELADSVTQGDAAEQTDTNTQTNSGALDDMLTQTVGRAINQTGTSPDEEEERKRKEEEERKRKEEEERKRKEEEEKRKKEEEEAKALKAKIDNANSIEAMATNNIKNQASPPPPPPEEKSKCCLLI